MKNINRKTGMILGIATAISLVSAVAGVMKVRNKYKKHGRFCKFEEDDMETEEDIQFWEEEYLKEEQKSEEEKQQEFRELSVTVLDALFREVLFISERTEQIEQNIKRQNNYEELMEELEEGKEEIIALWEHLEALSNMKEEYSREKGRG